MTTAGGGIFGLTATAGITSSTCGPTPTVLGLGGVAATGRTTAVGKTWYHM